MYENKSQITGVRRMCENTKHRKVIYIPSQSKQLRQVLPANIKLFKSHLFAISTYCIFFQPRRPFSETQRLLLLEWYFPVTTIDYFFANEKSQC